MFDTILVDSMNAAIEMMNVYKCFYPNGRIKAGISAGQRWVELEIMD